MKWPTSLRPHLNLHPSPPTILYNTYSTTLPSTIVIYSPLRLSTTHSIYYILHDILLHVFLHYYDFHYSCQFTVSTFHQKAVVPYSASMSWNINVWVLYEQTLHSRRSKRAGVLLLASKCSTLPCMICCCAKCARMMRLGSIWYK
jgi:hypothetical protein